MVEDGDLNLVKFCFDKGVNVNVYKVNMSILLYLVVIGGDLEIVKMLIEYDVNIEVKNVF